MRREYANVMIKGEDILDKEETLPHNKNKSFEYVQKREKML